MSRLLYGTAQFISVVAHPLFGPTYILLLLLAVNPYLFGVNAVGERLPFIALVFGSSALIPGLVILMMRGLEMIPDLAMPERDQRTIPLIAVGMLYLGLFAFCRKAPDVPVAYTALVLGCVAGLFGAFFVNLFSKISLHAVGMGGITAAVVVTLELFAYDRFVLALPGGREARIGVVAILVLAIALAGVVGSARLVLGAHELRDVVGGYAVGFAAMGIAVWAYF